MLLEDLEDELEDRSDFNVQPAKLELHEDTDGCAEQYRSATSLYMLSKLAFENDLVYCRAIDAEGHGKKSIDGLSGNDKADLDKALRGLVEYQPECMKDNQRQVLFVDVKDGKKQDFAIKACEILGRPERKHGVERVPCNKPRKEKEDNDRAISSRHYKARDDTLVRYPGMKKEAKGFSSRRRSGREKL